MRKAVSWAILLTIFQVLLALALAPRGGGFAGSYRSLLNWDSFHYIGIVENDYHVVHQPTHEDVDSGRANAVFFPAYPWLARGVRAVTGASTGVALLLVSQAACFAFWLYFLVLLEWEGVDRRKRALAVVTVAAFPSAFFLVAGYTESLFLASMLGFVYWSCRMDQALERAPDRGEKAWPFWLAAAAHGILMTATRVVGLGPALFPLLLWGGKRVFSSWVSSGGGQARTRAIRRWVAPLSLSLVSFAGCVGFLAYCQWKLGNWDVYFQLERIGWGNFEYPLALLDPRSYVPHFFFETTVDSISRSAVPFTALLFGAAACAEWPLLRKPKAVRDAAFWRRIALYAVALAVFQIAVSAKARANMDSMIRYTLPCFALWVLAIAGVPRADARRAGGAVDSGIAGVAALWPFKTGRAGRVLIAFGYLLAVATQIWLEYRFLRGRWVA